MLSAKSGTPCHQQAVTVTSPLRTTAARQQKSQKTAKADTG